MQVIKLESSHIRPESLQNCRDRYERLSHGQNGLLHYHQDLFGLCFKELISTLGS